MFSIKRLSEQLKIRLRSSKKTHHVIQSTLATFVIKMEDIVQKDDKTFVKPGEFEGKETKRKKKPFWLTKKSQKLQNSSVTRSPTEWKTRGVRPQTLRLHRETTDSQMSIQSAEVKSLTSALEWVGGRHQAPSGSPCPPNSSNQSSVNYTRLGR